MKNGNASCAFSTKFSKLILLTLNVGHLFFIYFAKKMVEFLKSICYFLMTSQMIRKLRLFYGKITYFQIAARGHLLMT